MYLVFFAGLDFGWVFVDGGCLLAFELMITLCGYDCCGFRRGQRILFVAVFGSCLWLIDLLYLVNLVYLPFGLFGSWFKLLFCLGLVVCDDCAFWACRFD